MRFSLPGLESEPRDAAQDFCWDAMDLLGKDDAKSAKLCREALKVYPDCVDALAILAELENDQHFAYVAAMRLAVEAGRRDLGPECFERDRGMFWGLIETRPFMRALGQLADALRQWGTPEHVEEAIALYEEMLELNPNDNQGVRDVLAGLYLARRRYGKAHDLLKRYENDWMASTSWSRVLLAHATGEEGRAQSLLKEARKQNPHVELYLTGRKRRPRNRPGHYTPGEATEAVYCMEVLGAAWKAHPKSKRWVKEACSSAD